MLIRTARRAFAPRNLVATSILSLAVVGIAVAAVGSRDITNNSVSGLDIKNNSIASLDIQNNSITEADVKNGSLRGRDFKPNSITGAQIDESTLAEVPSAKTAATATSATTATTATKATSATSADTAKLAEKAAGITRIAPTFVAAFDAVDYTTGQTNAPFITLVETGSLKVQAKCFRDTGNDEVHSEVYATTTTDAATFYSYGSSLEGGPTVNNTTYLFTDSTLSDRRIASTSVTNNRFQSQSDQPFKLNGIDGSWINGDVISLIRNGDPAGKPTNFYGTEHSCAFFGDAAHSGAA